MTTTAKVIEHTASPFGGPELLTFQLRYPRLVHAEFMTHRVFSRNASSSRAIPVQKMIDQVRNDPATPIHWGKNQPGMQARAELEGRDLELVKHQWYRSAQRAADSAEIMMDLGAHKQVVNRILEPFQWISVIVTATEWDNWNELRDHEDADPNIANLARVMKAARAQSTPRVAGRHRQHANGWHLPYITADERDAYCTDPQLLAKISAARCARVSYLTHDGAEPQIGKDLELYERLVGSRPLHASPVEHQAYALEWGNDRWCKNFRGWQQFRELIELSVVESH